MAPKARPNFFRFASIKGEPGYQFNLKTTELVPGTYELKFQVGSGGPQLSVDLQLR